MRVGVALLTLSFLTMPAQADMKLIQLSPIRHRMSEVWDGQFRALDGSPFDTSAFCNPVKRLFSRRRSRLLNHASITALMPFTADAGRSQLYRQPRIELGLGVLWAKQVEPSLIGRSLAGWAAG